MTPPRRQRRQKPTPPTPALPIHDPLTRAYETTLSQHAPAVREQRGVYATPQPVASYIVRSVHHLIQQHFSRPMGLADEQVGIVDPAMGTGTLLLAAAQHIHATLVAAGQADTWPADAPRLLRRMAGIEVLREPYEIARQRVQHFLAETGCPDHATEQVRFLHANALSRNDPLTALLWGDERDESLPTSHVLVLLGNPPYLASSANKGMWETPVRQSYYPNDAIREQNPKLLLDDYVRFIRYGQWHIEQHGQGMLAFVTNHAYLDNPTFRGMRRSLLETFSDIFLLNLHGNIKRGDTAPDGLPDDNVFEIQQGVAIGLFVRRPAQAGPARVCYADLWGPRATPDGHGGKYAWLAAHDVTTTDWQVLHPQAPFSLFVPYETDTLPEYETGWKVTDLFTTGASGIKTHRDHFVLDVDPAALTARIADFRDLSLDDALVRERYNLHDTRDWKLERKRRVLHQDEQWHTYTTRCLYRPFDWRTLYYHAAVVERGMFRVMRHMLAGPNLALVTVRQVAENTFTHAFVADTLVACRTMLSNKGAGYVFPLYCYADVPRSLAHWQGTAAEMSSTSTARTPNLSPGSIAALEAHTGLRFLHDGDGRGDMVQTIGAEDVFHMLYALLHHPTYRQRYASFLKMDFPRLPLPDTPEQVAVLANLGATLVDLHLLRGQGSGGVGGSGGVAALDNPSHQGITFAGEGDGHIAWVRYIAPQGAQAGRVSLNHTQSFVGIAPNVWGMQVGGYRPLEQWLQSRKGRTLSQDDVQHVLRVAVALREMLRVQQQLEQTPLRLFTQPTS